MQLRDYQQQGKNEIYEAWQQHHQHVAYVLPTGGGKTVMFADIINDHKGFPTCAIAHRTELVSQIALALARYGVAHRVIGPNEMTRYIINYQREELGTSFYNPSASCAVASVDTLIRRTNELSRWLPQVRLWVTDECHHILKENKWGKAIEMFPNAKGLGVTATPIRADGKGLGRHTDGWLDTLIEGPPMRQLIEENWLTDYRIFAPPNDLDLSEVNVTATGDYNHEKLKTAVRKSHIIGDVVKHYLRIAPGKLGITFASDVDTATDIARQFNVQGVPAEVVHAKTKDRVRTEIIRRFRDRKVLQLVNVDLFGEGFDLPAIEVCSMARPTESYGLYCQQFGRALRPMEGKTHAIIIDHVGNVVRHGLPDKERIWSLDAREKRPRTKGDEIPLRYCPECTSPYERILERCPFCGHKPVPSSRSAPEFVDGDLYELDPLVLAEMRGQIAKIDNPADTIQGMKKVGQSDVVINSFRKNALARCDAQDALRESMSWWAAYQYQQGRTDREAYRLFYFTFGTDVYSAQTLGRPEALALAERINKYLGEAA